MLRTGEPRKIETFYRKYVSLDAQNYFFVHTWKVKGDNEKYIEKQEKFLVIEFIGEFFLNYRAEELLD